MPKGSFCFIMNGLQFIHNLWVNYRNVPFGIFLGDIIDKYLGIKVTLKE